jgi:hypothetical protein
MVGIDNPALTTENVNRKLSNEKVESKELETSKDSPLMFISLTIHSLGIIFGDM